MSRKKLIMFLVSIALLIGVFVLIGAAVTSTTGTNIEAEADTTGDDIKSNESSPTPEKEAAEKLIEETLSREEIEKDLGKWDDFEMSSAGCERGVYSGKFFYKDFTIYSRTYDKGETFHIMSVNEQ